MAMSIMARTLPSTIRSSATLAARRFVTSSARLGADFLFSGYQRGAAFGDLNNDGALDLVVTSLNAPPRILMNSGVAGAHWLIVDAQGTKSNRDAIGAKMMLVTASGRKLYNHVTTAQGFLSSADRRVHFGLGQEKAIRMLEVTWPTGVVQRVQLPKPDQILHIIEQ